MARSVALEQAAGSAGWPRRAAVTLVRGARAAWQMTRAAAVAWVDDYAPSMGAALSYYTVFSLAPLLFIVLAVSGLVFGAEAARGELFAQLSGLMGSEAAAAVETMLQGLARPARGAVSLLVSGAMLFIGATTVFGELQDALDRIWHVPARDRSSGLWGLIRARLLSFGLVLGVAFLLMVSLVLSAAIAALGKWWAGAFGSWELVARSLDAVIGYAMTTFVFAMIYKFIPRTPVAWRDVWLGAAITAALFTLGRMLIGMYIGKTGIASGFGAAGSVAVIFVWVYYSAQIFLLGAEFTRVHAGWRARLRGPAGDC